jgi:hypothetical protein
MNNKYRGTRRKWGIVKYARRLRRIIERKLDTQ